MDRIPEPGVLLADWDEAYGARVVVAHLPGIDEDPEVLANQAYMTTQAVFDPESFVPVSFTLPNLRLDRQVKHFFDVLPDETVRGGKRPVVLMVFFPLDADETTLAAADSLAKQALESHGRGDEIDGAVLSREVAGAVVGVLREPALQAVPVPGTPSRPVSRGTTPRAKQARTTGSAESEALTGQLREFNQLLAQAISDAKRIEKSDPARAKAIWLKIVEFCREFAAKPGVSWDLKRTILERTRAIEARANRLLP
ncbi:MAG: hypothetical protein Kow0069_08040 [Promethearchaeota archaeon]